MKRIYLIICVLSILFASCADDPIGVSKENDSDKSAPGKVSNIRHEADHGSLIFYWSPPSDADYFYTDISYTADGTEYSKKVTFYNDSTVIEGFATSSTYEFTFYAVDKNGNRSAGESYSAAPLQPPHLLVASTVDVVSNEYGGVIIKWKNESGKQVNVQVTYIGDTEGKLTQTFSPNASVIDNEGEVKTDLSLPTDSKAFTIVVTDANGNASTEKNFNVPLYEYLKISRDNWEFPGFDDNSNAATNGYSSQEAGGEGATPNGRIIALIDNDTSTFWHSAWTSSSSYPHWFIIDMHQSILIREVELQRRQGNGGTAKGFTLYTCKDVAVDQNDPVDGYPWENHGHFAFDPSTNDAQKIKITPSPTARYVKMYFDTSDQGSSGYTMFAEFAVWGQRESD